MKAEEIVLVITAAGGVLLALIREWRSGPRRRREGRARARRHARGEVTGKLPPLHLPKHEADVELVSSTDETLDGEDDG